MKVVVTGGTGFIGRALIAKLRERGDTVVALVRSRERAKSLAAELVEADIESSGEWRNALEGCDAIIHLAGEPVAGKRWDACAADALVTAAGGILTDTHGDAIDYRAPSLSNDRGLVCSNRHVHRSLIDGLAELRSS